MTFTWPLSGIEYWWVIIFNANKGVLYVKAHITRPCCITRLSLPLQKCLQLWGGVGDDYISLSHTHKHTHALALMHTLSQLVCNLQRQLQMYCMKHSHPGQRSKLINVEDVTRQEQISTLKIGESQPAQNPPWTTQHSVHKLMTFFLLLLNSLEAV